MTIQLYTIGFTQKSAEQFFGALRGAQVRTLLDIRINNRSQLAGFAKGGDLAFFLRELCGADYVYVPECAPPKDLLDAFRKDKNWDAYVAGFLPLIAKRKIETVLTPEQLDRGCLLCSEATPEHCHRRLVAEYLRDRIPGLSVTHL